MPWSLWRDKGIPVASGRSDSSPRPRDKLEAGDRSENPIMSQYKYSTLAVHAGQHPDPLTGAVNVPVYLSSTFELTGIGSDRGWDYSRAGNPTRDRLETALAALEGGTSGHAFTTGMAAISALVAMLRAGDHIVCSRDVYAGTVRLFDQIVSGYGIQIEYVDTSNLAAVEAAMKPNTKLVHIETPSNPLMVLTDIAGVAEDRPCARRRSQRRQHLSVARAAAPAGAGRRHRDALDHEVPERPLRRPGRGADRLKARAQGALSACAEGGWRRHVALRVLPGACAASRRCLCASSSTKRMAARWRSSSPRTRR